MLRGMKTKRLLAAVLWTFTAWYAWNFVAAFAGLPATFGPIIGVLVAVAVTWLPGQRWSVPSPAPASVQTEA